MRQRNGIPIDIPGARKQVPKVKTQKPVEYSQYNVYVTMFKYENGQNIWTMVPLMHPDFKELKAAGYRITEKWDKREVSA
ncbi:hypothetical protein ACIQZG_02420 [Lysinibacillus sp. NPDC096418]|uniref:hypothetical protein n=1 Tax=Lysinibacillus sp. NPDC096418 TaxID=3364138 RepID=UPI0037FE86DE